MCIVDSSMYIEHIINPVHHQINAIKSMKIEGSMKSIRNPMYEVWF
jgi:hypothetical protein